MPLTNRHLQTIRAASIGLVILGAVFKLMHWPGSDPILLVALIVMIITLLYRLLPGRTIWAREVIRDVALMGLLGTILARRMDIPGKPVFLIFLVAGALAMIWSEKERIFLSIGERSVRPWLFYMGLGLVLLGTFFRLQHWPYSMILIISGLMTCAIWMAVSRHQSE